MATVTISKPYFEALLRRAEFHTSNAQDLDIPDLFDHVFISRAEHNHLIQAMREYASLKSALLQGGLTTETLSLLLSTESDSNEDVAPYTCDNHSERHRLPGTNAVSTGASTFQDSNISPLKHTTWEDNSVPEPKHCFHAVQNHAINMGFQDLPGNLHDNERDGSQKIPGHEVPVHDQRTILVTNLSDRTAHEDLVGIIRGGRLLDICIRHDRTATISFAEGAQDFLAYTKRKDIYLHTKRLEFRWNDRQFHVPPHVASKMSRGATRNLVVRGAGGKLTGKQMRHHLDHIHNLVVINITFRSGDAYISTNSIHNALYAKTCLMSRTAYKCLRVDWYPDECAIPLPQPENKHQNPTKAIAIRSVPITNPFSVLDTDSADSPTTEEDSP